MKRITILALTFSFALAAKAEPVSKQAAHFTAQTYMLSKGKTIEANPVPTKGNRKKSPFLAGNDWVEAFYVFNA